MGGIGIGLAAAGYRVVKAYDCEDGHRGPELEDARAEALAEGCQHVTFKSVFEVLRRPF